MNDRFEVGRRTSEIGWLAAVRRGRISAPERLHTGEAVDRVRQNPAYHDCCTGNNDLSGNVINWWNERANKP